MSDTLTLNVNGQDHQIDALPASMLLYALRDDLGLRGTKFGCGLSQCGACTVLMDGAAVRSCVTPLSAAQGTKITTLEGLGTPEKPHPLQAAFVEEQALQCGYCINGMIMTAAAFLETNPKPSRDDIKGALNGNLCRCGTICASSARSNVRQAEGDDHERPTQEPSRHPARAEPARFPAHLGRAIDHLQSGSPARGPCSP
jgi:nicotinate dehydrogenase subunit A